MILQHNNLHYSDSLLGAEKRLIHQAETPKSTPDPSAETKPERPSMEQVEQKWKKAHEEGEAFLENALRDTEEPKGPQGKVIFGESTYVGAGPDKKFTPGKNPSNPQVNREAEAAIAELDKSASGQETATAGVADYPDVASLSADQVRALDAAAEAAKKRNDSTPFDRPVGRNEGKKEKDQS